MEFTINYEVPQTVAEVLKQNWNLISKKNLEDLAVIGYKMKILTSYQVQLMLNMDSRWETEEFLHRHQCYLHYDEKDFEEDGKVMDKILNNREES